MDIRHISEGKYKMIPNPDSKEWTFETNCGIIVIPNFFETFYRQYKRKIGIGDVDFIGAIPTVDDDKYSCEILYGEWFQNETQITQLYNLIGISGVEIKALFKENKS